MRTSSSIQRWLFLERSDNASEWWSGMQSIPWRILATPGEAPKIIEVGSEIPNSGNSLVIRFLNPDSETELGPELGDNREDWRVWCHLGGDVVAGDAAKSPETKWREYRALSEEGKMKVFRANGNSLPCHYSKEQKGLSWGPDIQRAKDLVRSKNPDWVELTHALHNAWDKAFDHLNIDAKLHFQSQMLPVTLFYQRLHGMLSTPCVEPELLAKTIDQLFVSSGVAELHPSYPDLAVQLRQVRLRVEHAAAVVHLLLKVHYDNKEKGFRLEERQVNVLQRMLSQMNFNAFDFLCQSKVISQEITEHLTKRTPF